MAVIKRAQAFSPYTIKPELFADLTASFNIHPNKLDLDLNLNEDAVMESIRNILRTRRGERLFNPQFGSDINSILFENITPQTEYELKTYIETAITNFEPRAKLMSVDVTAYPDENGYAISIVFSVINRSDPIRLDFILDRIR